LRTRVLAAKRYSASKLTRVDDHTVECEVQRVTYVPIPLGSGLNHTGLITVELPEGVQSGQLFTIVVRQVSHAPGRATPPPEPEIDVAAAEDFSVVKYSRGWQRVIGTFQISIPVHSKQVLLEPEERLLSVLRWILESVPTPDRWYPVFRRYVDEIANRVRGLGGEPGHILPSPTGEGVPTPERPQKPRPEARRAFTGKIAGLIFDYFGDFEGFLLETEEGTRKFLSREHEVAELAERAWSQRLRITVLSEMDEPERPMTIIIRQPPSPFSS